MSGQQSTSSGAKQSGAAGGVDRLASLSSFSEKADKILSFLGKVLSIVGGVLWFVCGWLREQVLVMPRQPLNWSIGIALVVGLSLWLLSCCMRNRWNKWAILLWTIIGGLCVGSAGLLWYFAPEAPQWQRLNVPQILLKNEEKHDLPIMLVLDQLAGRNKLIPGGETYKSLLNAKYDNKRLLENWAAYYTPLLVPSTMPKTVTLRDGRDLNPRNASLGVFLFVWNNDAKQIKVSIPQQFGYKSLNHSVSLPVTLKRQERAAMMVFVYPWTAGASANLPDQLEEAVALEE